MWGPTTPWDAATMILPWELYATYGDTRILERMHKTQAPAGRLYRDWFKAPDYARKRL